MVAPKAFHAFAKDVPEYKTENTFIRVVQGHYEGLQSPIELVTPTTLLDVTIQPNTPILLDAKEMAFVYLISGDIQIADREVSNTAFINFEEAGDKVSIRSLDKTAQFLFLSGTPHHEPIVHGGPFVMTTQQQMQETQQRLQRGEMGILHPL